MTLLVLALILALSFYLLAKICDEYFIPSLDKISKRWDLSNDVAGATLMAIGSSAPELFIAIIALIKPGNHEAIGMGTIVGSAIFNVLVIIGVAAIIRRAKLTWQPVIRDLVFYSISIILLLLAFGDGQIDLLEAASFSALYVIYLIAVVNWRKLLPYQTKEAEEKVVQEVTEELTKKKTLFRFIFPSKKRYYLTFSLSILLIALLSWVLVESAVEIAHILNIPAAVVALTVLAVGTSVPDLISSIIVAKQGRGDMAISNAIGSNVFDILFGLGIPWLILLAFTGGSIPVSTENLYSSVVLLFATVLVIITLLLVRKWKIGHYSGYFLIFLYLAYLVWSLLHLGPA